MKGTETWGKVNSRKSDGLVGIGDPRAFVERRAAMLKSGSGSMGISW
jgi:hypothetical protein